MPGLENKPTGLNGTVYIPSFAVATPPYEADQEVAHAFFGKHYAARLTSRSRAVMRKVFRHPSVERRRFALTTPEILVDEDPDRRIERFTHWAVELSSRAAAEALTEAGVTGDDVTALVVNTCTGYICPGLSTYLIERMGLARSVRAYDLVGVGCGGAVPNLEVCASSLNGQEGVVLSVAVEICSATLQMSDDISLIVSNAIFADGAAAAVVTNRPGGLALVDSTRHYAPEYRDHIRYVYKHGQLHNQLSAELPGISGEVVGRTISDLLDAHGLAVADVKHWAMHPGGDKVINAVRDAAGLTEDQLAATRKVLAEYGNMSSATVWFVLRELRERGMAPGDWCVMLAFGAGMSAHAYLLQA